mgnify:CR=1 FL=1
MSRFFVPTRPSKRAYDADELGVAWSYGDANFLIGGSQNGNYRRSADGGKSFQSVNISG